MRIPFLVLIGLVTFGPISHADSLTYTTTPNGSGLFSYQFNLSNSGTTGGALYDLFLAVPLDIGFIDTGSIVTPIGWGDATGGLLFFGPDVNPSTSFVQWAADFSSLHDLNIGSSLTGFSFATSQQITGQITFAVNGSTSFENATQVSSVPEPGTFAPILLVLAFLTIRFGFVPSRVDTSDCLIQRFTDSKTMFEKAPHCYRGLRQFSNFVFILDLAVQLSQQRSSHPTLGSSGMKIVSK